MHNPNFMTDFVELVGKELSRISDEKEITQSEHDKAYLSGKFAALTHAVTLMRLARQTERTEPKGPVRDDWPLCERCYAEGKDVEAEFFPQNLCREHEEDSLTLATRIDKALENKS